MKTTFSLTLKFIVICFAVVGLLTTVGHYLRPNRAEGDSHNPGVSVGYDQVKMATTVHDWLEKKAAARLAISFAKILTGHELEDAQVLARSITYPGVLRRGDQLLKFDYPNTELFCVNAAYYAGRAMGLILAMDRHAVEEHGLFYTIDTAADVFDDCELILVEEYFAGQTISSNAPITATKDEIIVKIEAIQEVLKYARNVKFKARGLSVSANVAEAAQ